MLDAWAFQDEDGRTSSTSTAVADTDDVFCFFFDALLVELLLLPSPVEGTFHTDKLPSQSPLAMTALPSDCRIKATEQMELV